MWLNINCYFKKRIGKLDRERHGTYRFLQNQNSVPDKAPPMTVKEAITPTMTKTLPWKVLSFLVSWTPSLFFEVLFPSSVGGMRCSDVTSVVEVSVVRSLDRGVVSCSVMNVLGETFKKVIVVVPFFFMVAMVEVIVTIVVESFCFVNWVVTALLVVLEFFCGIVVTCEDVVVRSLSLLSVVKAIVEVVVTIDVESFCFVNWVVTALLVVLEFFCGVVVTCEDVVVRSLSLLSVVKAMVEVVVTTVWRRTRRSKDQFSVLTAVFLFYQQVSCVTSRLP